MISILLAMVTVLVIIAAWRAFNITEAKAQIKEELLNEYNPDYPRGENAHGIDHTGDFEEETESEGQHSDGSGHVPGGD